MERLFLISCSHILITLKPSLRRLLLTLLALATFDFNFAVQYARFARGNGRRHWGQPCQKQPSMKIATCSFGKTKSGTPGSQRACIFQPLIPCRTRAARSFHSVERLPVERTALIRWLRSSLLKISIESPAEWQYKSSESTK